MSNPCWACSDAKNKNLHVVMDLQCCQNFDRGRHQQGDNVFFQVFLQLLLTQTRRVFWNSLKKKAG